jgi:Domain of unknown function (DUF5063)
MRDVPEVVAFEEIARRYVRLIDSDERLSVSALAEVLPALYAAALRLPDVEPDSTNASDVVVTPDEYKQVNGRVGRLTLTPRSLEDWELYLGPEKEESRGGWLADDLADIWRDLETGFRVLDGGGSEADVIWEWRFSF